MQFMLASRKPALQPETHAFPDRLITWPADYLAKVAGSKAVPQCELSHAVAPLEQLAERYEQIEIQHPQHRARPQQQQVVNGLHPRYTKAS